MRPKILMENLITAALAIIFLLLGAHGAVAQQQVNLTAGAANIALPDGTIMPMWGYSCTALSSGIVSTATCSNLNPAATGTFTPVGSTTPTWSPVVIRVPSGASLQINLANKLIFGSNSVPTSLVIVGQVGGGLGNSATTTPSPTHATGIVSWPIAGSNPPSPVDPIFTPPIQGNRVQSFAKEVAAGATTSLCWGTACPSPTPALRPGTYLLESGTHPSIQGPMGLYGIVVVTSAPSAAGNTGTAYPNVAYTADVPLLFSEIDPAQNKAVNTAVNTAGFSETKVWSGLPGGCGNALMDTGAVNPLFNTCYPPVVNYSPRYYLINGVSFDKTGANAANSYFPLSPAGVPSGQVLVRIVNAGLRMHVPSIVGALSGSSLSSGFALVAEDGNVLPGVARIQSEVFLAAGKTYDVMINMPPANTALPIFDRQLSLSTNGQQDGGMQAYIGAAARPLAAGLIISGTTGTLSSSGLGINAVAVGDTYNSVIAGQTLSVLDPAKGVIANDKNVYGVQLLTAPTKGVLVCGAAAGICADGTFTYVPNAGWSGGDQFVYQANGNPAITATVILGAAQLESSSGITCTSPIVYSSNVAALLSINSPGILSACKDALGYPLTVAMSAGNAPVPASGLTLSVDKSGSFQASVASPGTYTFTFKAQNSQGVVGSSTAIVMLTFPTANAPLITLLDGKTKSPLSGDYRWIIEEDQTFYVNPNCTQNPLPAGCPTVTPQGGPAVFNTNFHTSHMPMIATGCTGPLSCESGQTMLDPAGTGAHVPAVCDLGNGVCRPDLTGNGQTPTLPSQVHLDPTKRYYISVLPGDAPVPFEGGNLGHTMGGAPIVCVPTAPAVACTSAGAFLPVNVFVNPTPLQTAKLTVFVFQDDFPLNGEHDTGGGVDVLSPNEPGLGGFEIKLFDDAGGTGDPTGQITYDMFNMPLSNALAGTINPVTGNDACPISKNPRKGIDTNTGLPGAASPTGITGMVPTCPLYESDGKTLSSLAGQAVVANLFPGRYGVVATPAADRIARGEEWLQTNTLDGQKAHDSFMRVGEPSYFQEYGPAGYHVSIGFANPKIINDRKAGICAAAKAADPTNLCNHAVSGQVTGVHMSRTPDERLYSSGSRDTFSFTQCYVSLGDPDGQDFAFTKCDSNGNFTLSALPAGAWKVTVFDQWNDQIVDGIATAVNVDKPVVDMGQIAVNQWQANISTRTYLDKNGNGIPDRDAAGNDLEPGLALIPTNIRYRDGSFSNFNNTDLNGYASFNEVFPLFSWYVIETDSARFKNTGTHVVYDAGGPTDGSPSCLITGSPACGNSIIGQFMARTYEDNPLPNTLRVPGSYYCASADCINITGSGLPAPGGPGGSTGRIDPAWVDSYGWQGYAGQNSFLEFGKRPFAEALKDANGNILKPAENGGIHGHVVYASTRPFDDPQLLLQLSWEPLVPNVTMNLYQEGTDLNTGAQTLKLVDTTQTSSFDAWAQGFYPGTNKPYMNCPGQSTSDLFFYALQGQPNYLDWYNSQHGGAAVTPLPNSSQFKCYDGMHNWNQLQPAPYDGMYKFPSVAGRNTTTGAPTGTNCTACITNPVDGTPMLPAGKYVVEVVIPPGYELVKEEDKNILIGDNFIAPVTQEFAGLANIFILPDQAAVGSAFNANNVQNSTTNLGTRATGGIDATKTEEQAWPCVGQARVVPDYISLFPGSMEVAPFAGATRNLCDRKEVTLDEQMSVIAKFFIFTSTHTASHFTGLITDDFTSEFDPFSPQFGEKFAPAYLPVSVKDFNGNEVSRTLTDQFGAYNGLNYSTWEVNPPNPTGYSPTMMVVCMNDRGTGVAPDKFFQDGYSQFCYELPFMPGQTGYFDTPVVPNSAFSEGFNHPDCDYPDATPAISSVIGDAPANGPWVSAAGHTLTINALGNQQVENYAYSGPSVATAPFNQQKVTRHYGFGTTAGTVGLMGSDNVVRPLTGVLWSDTVITGVVPSGLPNCPGPAQQQQYGGGTGATVEKCGQLVITASNGKQSIDTVTVTVGGKTPTALAPGQTIQSAIDAASPGDMIIVPAGTYNEMLLMWKPVRLQGVGGASSIIDANTQPAGKLLDPWRVKVVCLFGLGIDGVPNTWNSSCGAGLNYFTATPLDPQVDRLPLEATVGWDASLNGNLAEQLQEPTLMGAYEGAGITVLSKGVDFHGSNPWTDIAEAGAFPANTTLLTGASRDCGSGTTINPHPSNFLCNPSSIDGLGITNSSQGGGGIFVHGWGHNIQIANNRVYSNNGTLSGGITIGQGEHPGAYLGGAAAANAAPGSCQTSNVTNLQLPFCFDLNVNVHHNEIKLNSSTGDELFSSTPAGAGGVTFCTGSDFYKFNYNWVCGNLSTGDGGGVAHLGFAYNADIEHNSILFNQSTNPTISTNGGGLLILGAPDTDPLCTTIPDKDCPTGLGDGTGPGMVINANLILGNAAESGSGGGMRFQGVNGTEVSTFPTTPSRWYSILAQNNIIANNVAGWDGGGVSLQDALNVNFINNTVVSNNSTASSGDLFNSLFAPLASAPGNPCVQPNGSQSCPQVAGLVSVPNSPGLIASLPATITCPTGHGTGGTGTGGLTNGACRRFSYPLLYNDVFWQNSSYFVGVGSLGTGSQNQQNVVALYNAFAIPPALAPTQVASQPSTDATTPNGNGDIITGGTGACIPASYWDVGVRGDTGPRNHSGSTAATPLSMSYSIITDSVGYSGTGNSAGNPTFVRQYCNGSRTPPEICNPNVQGGVLGCLAAWGVPPGTNETNVPVPLFNLQPTATVDEGNNWINMRWGPLSLTNTSNGSLNGATLGNYAPATGSPAVNSGTNTASGVAAPTTDFFGNPRPAGGAFDMGAVELGSVATLAGSVTGGPLTFGSLPQGGVSAAQVLTLHNTGTLNITGIALAFSSPQYSQPAGNAGGTCGTTLTPAAGTCTINVVFSPTAVGSIPATLTITSNATIAGSPVSLSGTGTAAAIVSFTGPVPALNSGGLSTKNGVVTVHNTGAAALTLTALPTIAKAGGAGTGTASIQPGGTCISGANIAATVGTCTLNVRWVPTTAETANLSVTLTDTGAASGSQTSSTFPAN
jgi:hypothetical protein